tara:strand:+ start:935 stop:1150 length:216 start_codon:yes stop_codon:yes gene_type:complete
MTRTRRQHAYKNKKVDDRNKAIKDGRKFLEEMNSGYYHDEGDWDSPRDHRPLDFSDGFIYDEVKRFNQDLG